MTDRRLFNLRDASEYLNLSIATLRALVADGKLTAVRTNPRGKILVDIHELESFCERNTRTPDMPVGGE